jgi:hypothetical protein
MLRVIIWALLASCAIVAVVGLLAELSGFGTVLLVLGSVGFFILALLAIAERRYRR